MPNPLSQRLRSILRKGELRSVANVPLRWVLVVPFVLQTVGAVTLVGYLSYRSGQQAIADLAGQLMVETGRLVSQELDSYFETAQLEARSTAYMLQAGYLDGASLPAVEPYLVQQLQLIPTLSTLAIANEGREFIAVERSQPPSLIIRRFQPGGNNPGFYRYRADSDGKNLMLQDVRQNFDPHNDPPGSPWYEEVRRSPTGAWRLVVSLAEGETTPILNLIYLLPFRDRAGNFQGAIGSGIYLTQLGQFLQQLNAGKTGQVFLLDADGVLVATSTGEVPFDRKPSPDHAQNVAVRPRRLLALQSQDPVTRAAASYLRQQALPATLQQPQSSSFWLDQQRYFVHTVPNHGDLDWLGVIVVPESDFMATIWAGNSRTLLLCLLTLLGSIGLGWMTAKRITKPIAQLNRASRSLANGEWQEPLPEETSIAELKTLIQSCNQTSDQLRQSFQRIKIALEKSEEKFTTVFRTIPDPVSIVTLAEGRILEVNNSFIEFYGYSREEVMGRTTTELELWCSPQERQQFRTLLQQQGFVQNLEVQRRTKSGELKTVLLSAELRVLEGEDCVIAVARDISLRKAAEAALRVSEERYRGLIDDQTELICRFQPDGTMTFVNSSYCRHYGKSEAELIGTNFLDLTLPTEREYVEQLLQELNALTPENPLAIQEQRGLRADGQIGWQQWTNRAIFAADGQVEFQGVGRDITDRKLAELALQASKAQLSSVLDSSNASIAKFRLFADQQWKYEYWSEGCESVFGYMADEFLTDQSLWISRLLPEDVEQGRVVNLESFMQNEETTLQGQYRFFHKDGRLRWAAFHATSRPDADSEWVVTVIDIDITDRKQAELALEQTLQELNYHIENSPLATIRWNQDFQVEYWSEQAEQIFGWTAEEALGRLLTEWHFVFEEDVGSVNRATAQLLAGMNGICTNRNYRKDGAIVFCEWYNSVLYDEAGKVVSILSLAQDITERKQAEFALQQSEARLKEAQRVAQLGSWEFEVATQQLLWSEELFHILGLDPTQPEPVYAEAIELIPLEDRVKLLAEVDRVIRDGSSYELEHRACRPDGTFRYLLSKGQAALDSRQRVVKLYGTVLDITERKQIEEALRASETRLRLALNASSAVVWERDLETNEILFTTIPNSNMPTLQKYSYQQALALVHPEDQEALHRANQQAIAECGSFQIEHRVLAAGETSEWRWFLVSATVLANEAGQPTRIIGLSIDITDRKQTEQELQQAKEAAEAANRAKSAFLANMSHELRSPLHTILGFTQLMQRDIALSANHQKSLQLIYKGGNHLLKLISEILNLAKIEAGRLTLNNQAFNLPDLLYSLQTMFSQRASSQAIAFHLNLMPDVPRFVIADSQKIQQVLINLFSNALKFTPQGQITLHVDVDRGQNDDENDQKLNDREHNQKQNNYENDSEDVNENEYRIQKKHLSELTELAAAQISVLPSVIIRFRVEDTGIGIASQDLNLIFDPFAQASAGQRMQEGTGLGLTISRRLVQLMGGDLTVRSVLGQGSTFQFAVPMQSMPETTISPPTLERLVVRLAPGQPAYRILVVDDQPDNRLLLVQLFEQLGLEVKEAATGQEAIVIWRQWQPHLVWMDIRMPDLDGYEATRRIRRLEQCPPASSPHRTVIIALTAQASEDDRVLALAAGCNDYVTKPFREKILLSKMAEHLRLQLIEI